MAPSTPKILILADDLSGAADCASPFASAGLKTVVQWGGRSPFVVCQNDADVVAIDTATRHLVPKEASEKVAHFVQALARGSGQILYKKIDSTLRGNIGAETAAALSSLRKITPDAKLIFAPAFPKQARITRNHQQYVNGVQSKTDLPAIFAAYGIQDAQILDAETEGDLAAVAASAPRDALWVGSAGLARHLAGISSHATVPSPRLLGPILFVSGTASPVSRTQADVLSRQPGVREVYFDPTSANETPLKIHQDTLVRLPERVSMDPDAIRFALAYFVAAEVENAGALVLTGGDTARAVLDTIGVTALRVWGEIEPGVPLSISIGAWTRPVVTKAGGFGDANTLVHCRSVLKARH